MTASENEHHSFERVSLEVRFFFSNEGRQVSVIIQCKSLISLKVSLIGRYKMVFALKEYITDGMGKVTFGFGKLQIN